MKKCKLKINEKDYTLEMNRNSIKWLEAMGFTLEEFDKKPLTYFDLVWTSLFVSNHNEMTPMKAIELLETYQAENGSVMVSKVVKFGIDEYRAFMSALSDTSSKKNEKELEIIEV